MTVTGVLPRIRSLHRFTLSQQKYVPFWWMSPMNVQVQRKHFTQPSSIDTKSCKGFNLWSLCNQAGGLIQRPIFPDKTCHKSSQIPVIKWAKRSEKSRTTTTSNMFNRKGQWFMRWCSCLLPSSFLRRMSKARGSWESTEIFFHNMSRYPGKLGPSTKKFEAVLSYSFWACP